MYSIHILIQYTYIRIILHICLNGVQCIGGCRIYCLVAWKSNNVPRFRTNLNMHEYVREPRLRCAMEMNECKRVNELYTQTDRVI